MNAGPGFGIWRGSDCFYRPVIVAMIAMWMVKVASHQIIDMVAMGYSLVAAEFTMLVGVVVAVASVAGSAISGVFAGHFNRMFHHAGFGLVVQMPIVEVIHMVTVLHSGMAARIAVLMGMVVARHGW